MTALPTGDRVGQAFFLVDMIVGVGAFEGERGVCFRIIGAVFFFGIALEF